MIHLPNTVIIRGTGRNVGKTLSACQLISSLAGKHEPVGIKISPHFHELNQYPEYVHNSNEFVIVEEKFISRKDSSRMLQAGAKKVFYIQAKNNELLKAINLLMDHLNPDIPVVVESGGLYDFIEPALLINVVGEKVSKKLNLRKDSNAVFIPSGEVPVYDWNRIGFINGKFTIHA